MSFWFFPKTKVHSRNFFRKESYSLKTSHNKRIPNFFRNSLTGPIFIQKPIGFSSLTKPQIRSFSSTQSLKHKIYAWGAGKSLQLGNGENVDSNIPVLVSQLKGKKFIDIEASICSSFCVTKEHDVFAWGNNHFDQIGTYTQLVYQPTLVESLRGVPIVQVASGRAHTIFLSKHRELFALGSNEYGQLGIGTVSPKERVKNAVKIEKLSGEGIVHVACGFDHTIALSEDGRVWSWGWNIEGQLGYLNMDESSCVSLPTQIDLKGTKILRIACGQDTSALITEDGRLLTFGSSNAAQLGRREEDSSPIPQVVEDFLGRSVNFVALGTSHSLALVDEKDLYSWGITDAGQLGIGPIDESQEYQYTPKLIEALQGHSILQIGCGGAFSLVLTEDGSLYSFGNGFSGRLGHGDDKNQYFPKKIEFFNGKKIEFFSCGTDHALVVVDE